jgi:hypothetical protein
VHSEDNPVRSGMPDLRPSVELGTSLNWTLWRTADTRIKLDARFPARLAMTVESHPQFIGGQFFPHLNLDVHDPAASPAGTWGSSRSVYTDGRYNRYFYEVQPQYAHALRARLQSGGGYGGLQFLAALSKRFPKYWVGGFARYDTLNGAAFEQSPLVTSKRYFAAGLAISWIWRIEGARRGDALRGRAQMTAMVRGVRGTILLAAGAVLFFLITFTWALIALVLAAVLPERAGRRAGAWAPCGHSASSSAPCRPSARGAWTWPSSTSCQDRARSSWRPTIRACWMRCSSCRACRTPSA